MEAPTCRSAIIQMLLRCEEFSSCCVWQAAELVCCASSGPRDLEAQATKRGLPIAWTAQSEAIRHLCFAITAVLPIVSLALRLLQSCQWLLLKS